MLKTNKPLEDFLDILGEPILAGDYVCYSMHTHSILYIAKVIDWSPKHIKILDLTKDFTEGTYTANLKYDNSRFIKVPKMMIASLRMGLNLKEVNENKET